MYICLCIYIYTDTHINIHMYICIYVCNDSCLEAVSCDVFDAQ